MRTRKRIKWRWSGKERMGRMRNRRKRYKYFCFNTDDGHYSDISICLQVEQQEKAKKEEAKQKDEKQEEDKLEMEREGKKEEKKEDDKEQEKEVQVLSFTPAHKITILRYLPLLTCRQSNRKR